MVGCDGCGAAVRASDVECPVCGDDLFPTDVSQLGAPGIPVRRFGKVPAPAPEHVATGEPVPGGPRRIRPAPSHRAAWLVGAALALAGYAAWAGYPF